MPNLKELRNRISSVSSTKKITSAMKMVAASKLRKSQERAETARPYAMQMARLLDSLASEAKSGVALPRLMAGTGSFQKQLLIVFTADKGLCGGFNANIIRSVSEFLLTLRVEQKDISIITVGNKGRDVLKRDFAPYMVDHLPSSGKGEMSFTVAQKIAQKILTRFEKEEADVVTMFYNRFNSVMSQTPMAQQLIPFSLPPRAAQITRSEAIHEFEPTREEVLNDLVPRNITIQIYRALLESLAGENASRMTAMDNATRNASEMIGKLTLKYNRARQAYITKELIEIISGAEALGS